MKHPFPMGKPSACFLATLALVFSITAVLSYVKVGSLLAWRYTFDLFTYDQILQETLRGHIGLNYHYGNQLGEHALLLLFFFLPVKLLLGKYTIFFLLLFPTILYAVSAILLFVGIRSLTLCPILAFLGAAAFLLTYRLPQALYCDIFGVQVMDDAAGFLATLFVLCLALLEKGLGRLSWFFACYVSFLLLREDVALLGLIYAVLLGLSRRKRLHLVMIAISFIATAAEWLIVMLSSTPFNRGIEGIVMEFFHRVSVHGISRMLPASYVLTISTFVATMVICVVVTRRMSTHALPLFAIGLCKIGFGFAAHDRDLTTWHNHPGIVMLTGAIILQLVESPERQKACRALSVGVLLASIAFVADQLPFLERQIHENSSRGRLVAEYRDDLVSVIDRVPAEAVTAIPIWTAIEWTLHGHPRFSYYPRGVTISPRGIADYIVFERVDVGIRNPYNPFRTKQEILEAHREFQMVLPSRHFLLLKRVSESPGNESSRRAWMELFGRESLGL